jgi:hypothetical protein
MVRSSLVCLGALLVAVNAADAQAVRGRVVALNARWTDDHRSIDTIVTLEVERYLKGSFGPTLVRNFSTSSLPSGCRPVHTLAISRWGCTSYRVVRAKRTSIAWLIRWRSTF